MLFNLILQRWMQSTAFIMALAPVFVWGHSPSISGTYLTEIEQGKWVLQVRSSLAAFDYEVKRHFSIENYKNTDEFKQLINQHVNKNIIIHFNDNDEAVKLSNAKIQLGHEGVIVFEVTTPKMVKSISLTNTSFKNIYKSKSVLILSRKDNTKKRIILDKNNEFSAKYPTKK